MSNKAWKQHERRCAELIEGRRYPANQGGKIDIEGRYFIGQCKEVRTLSLAALTKLVEEMDKLAKVGTDHKLPVVCVKLRRGAGHESPTLMVVSDKTWRHLHYGFTLSITGE